jgi:hypothetical protein
MRPRAQQTPRPRQRRGSLPRGRAWLIAIFILLRGTDVLLYTVAPAAQKSQLLICILISALWTTVFLIGAWKRQNWCRHALIGLLLLSIACLAIFVPATFPALATDLKTLGVLVAATASYATILWALMVSRDIKRLTDRVS